MFTNNVIARHITVQMVGVNLKCVAWPENIVLGFGCIVKGGS